MGSCLFTNFIHFFEKTVKKAIFDDFKKIKYHIENMKSAELVLVDISK